MSSTMHESGGPYPFVEGDLQLDRLRSGAELTLSDFYVWRDDNPDAIAERIGSYHTVLEQEVALHTGLGATWRRLHPGRRVAFEQDKLGQWVGIFELFNAGEMPDPERCRRIGRELTGNVLRLETELDLTTGSGLKVSRLPELLAIQFPELAGCDELDWTGDRLKRLYRVLPETVVRAGGMGKVARTVMGVLALAAYDTFDRPPEERRARLQQVLPAAYAYGAAYVIVDDSLQDMPEGYLPTSEKDRYHRVITEGLASGNPIDASQLPDHPLAQMLHDAYGIITTTYPRTRYPHLYQAAESLYHAQHDESRRTIASAGEHGVSGLYANTMIKGAMTRVVADILAGRQLDDGFYRRIINTVFIGQMRDDLGDRTGDREADSLTPFTLPPERADGNPLYDLFAYDAYTAARIFGDDPLASDAMRYANAAKCAVRLHNDPRLLTELLRDYPCTDEMRDYLIAAAGLPKRVVEGLTSNDIRISHFIGQSLANRPAAEADPRTFVTDHREYIDAVIRRYVDDGPGPAGEGLGAVVDYALGGEGKRLRPALTLMLAESLDVGRERVEPLLAAIEIFHTASLVFDDLPAQDDAKLRRGRPVTHAAYPEYAAQIAGVSMIARSFAILGRLRQHFPAERVVEAIEYVGAVLGGELCYGQYLDLAMERNPALATGESITKMYGLKTSSMLEASLVPLLMLTGRSEHEIATMRQFAHHAGIVYQIRDDILDATAHSDETGKDAGLDTGKANLVRVYGLEEAESQMSQHLEQARSCCRELDFDTSLLQGMLQNFADRRR